MEFNSGFKGLNKGLKQWPHKQHQYHSACFLVLTQEQNDILHSFIESPKEKRIAQYQFKAITPYSNTDHLGCRLEI